MSGLGTASILGVQLFALWFSSLLRDAAADAARDADAAQQLTYRDSLQQALRTEYSRRYATLVDNVIPLLQRLHATGSVDVEIQHQARAESRRLRTLFEQQKMFDHPLMQQLRPVLDEAEVRQVETVVEVTDQLPVPPDDGDLTPLIGAVQQALLMADSSARLVISGRGTEFEISVVCRGESRDAGAFCPSSGVDMDIVTGDNSVWFMIRYQPPQEGRGEQDAARDVG